MGIVVYSNNNLLSVKEASEGIMRAEEDVSKSGVNQNAIAFYTLTQNLMYDIIFIKGR